MARQPGPSLRCICLAAPSPGIPGCSRCRYGCRTSPSSSRAYHLQQKPKSAVVTRQLKYLCAKQIVDKHAIDISVVKQGCVQGRDILLRAMLSLAASPGYRATELPAATDASPRIPVSFVDCQTSSVPKPRSGRAREQFDADPRRTLTVVVV